MCKVLMSIKLKYATQILNGAKTVEYRKNRFRRQNVEGYSYLCDISNHESNR